MVDRLSHPREDVDDGIQDSVVNSREPACQTEPTSQSVRSDRRLPNDAENGADWIILVVSAPLALKGLQDRLPLYQHERRPSVKRPPQRLTFYQRPMVKQSIQEMLYNGVIEPSSSTWFSPIVIVKKKDGRFRFCVDYCRLNSLFLWSLPVLSNCLWVVQCSSYLQRLIGTPIILGAPVEAPHGPVAFVAGRIKSSSTYPGKPKASMLGNGTWPDSTVKATYFWKDGTSKTTLASITILEHHVPIELAVKKGCQISMVDGVPI
ncbi:Transposon Ty3-G Gag-Pol polyprotein [Trichinella zimbabwensis]|uniref:Transposon Ty3-G Gag-Pol polyprotein n=1 Tax=Trichinella zimbabwensis TaxID=268475 RepID=A0A0V1HSP8_9BILA|nr:Transposon Ty3-G Gag-Pol polyprotein [Trichinella zimbabwensis]